MFLISNSLIMWSLEVLTIQYPFGENRQHVTAALWGKRVLRLLPVLGSQSLIGCWASLLPDTNKPIVGCQCTVLQSAPWPSKHFKNTLQLNMKQKNHEAISFDYDLRSKNRDYDQKIYSFFDDVRKLVPVSMLSSHLIGKKCLV